MVLCLIICRIRRLAGVCFATFSGFHIDLLNIPLFICYLSYISNTKFNTDELFAPKHGAFLVRNKLYPNRSVRGVLRILISQILESDMFSIKIIFPSQIFLIKTLKITHISTCNHKHIDGYNTMYPCREVILMIN